jgi:site-specific recombinase XerD
MKTTNIQSSWKEILEDFYLTGKVEGKSKRTIEWYECSLLPLIISLQVPPSELEASHIRKHISSLHEQGLKPASIETKVRAIKAFLNFLYKEGYITEELSKRIPKPKTPHQYPYVLNDEQVDDLMKACDKTTWEGFRNYVILLTFLKCLHRVIN